MDGFRKHHGCNTRQMWTRNPEPGTRGPGSVEVPKSREFDPEGQ